MEQNKEAMVYNDLEDILKEEIAYEELMQQVDKVIGCDSPIKEPDAEVTASEECAEQPEALPDDLPEEQEPMEQKIEYKEITTAAPARTTTAPAIIAIVAPMFCVISSTIWFEPWVTVSVRLTSSNSLSAPSTTGASYLPSAVKNAGIYFS
jgi:hypothetical protein